MSKDWTMNIGTFSKDWVMNIGAYSTGESGGGGGDSGDWSTAQVTFISTKGDYYPSIPVVSEEGLVIERLSVLVGTPVTYEIPLYKGSCYLDIGLFRDIDGNLVCTGGVEYVHNEFHRGVVITGDGTFSADGTQLL